MRAFALAGLALVAVGCRTSVEPTDYATDCTVDADCVVAIVGDLCAPCLPATFTPALRTNAEACAPAINGALSARDSARYAADYAAIQQGCFHGGIQRCSLICRLPIEAFCNEGRCDWRNVPER